MLNQYNCNNLREDGIILANEYFKDKFEPLKYGSKKIVQLMCREKTHLFIPNYEKEYYSKVNSYEEKFSASYGGIIGNFIIKSCAINKIKIDKKLYGVLCVIQNILHRGNITRASDYLKEQLGSIIGEAIFLDDSCNNENISEDIRIKYDTVMRLETSLLSVFKHGLIDLANKSIHIYVNSSDINDMSKLINLAYDDIKLWFNNIVQLLKLKINLPDLIIEDESKENIIKLDFYVFRNYTDNIKIDDNCSHIYVCSDFYDKFDYFKVASSEALTYKFTANEYEKDKKALSFLMKNIFGHADFREGQEPIVRNILAREDTIGILPTGTGKSLCYQLAALLQPGVTLVIVPIISLMQDQKKSMINKGITRAAFVSSDVLGTERNKLMNDFIEGSFQFMLMSPERCQSNDFREILIKVNMTQNFAMAVIDEVHCLSEWGHDFRISYLTLIPTIRKYCSNANILGLTATASQAVLQDLKVEFGNDGSGIKALASMDRPELEFKRYIIESEDEKKKVIEQIVKDNDKTYTDCKGKVKNSVGLIFCPTVNGAGITSICNMYEFTKQIPKMKDRVLVYHANEKSLSRSQRNQNQKIFMEKDFSGVMVCTKAFGMGVDKENIKYTIHASLPQSIESFYQEAGRAGRDEDKKLKSYSYVLYSPELKHNEKLILDIFSKNISIDERKEKSKKLSKDLRIIMFFWNQNRKSLEEEFHDINGVLTILKQGNYIIKFFNSSDKNIKERALYKLNLLGIISGWSIKYTASMGSGNLNVDFNGAEVINIKAELLRYIRKYDPEFSVDGKISRYKTYYNIMQLNKDEVEKLIRVLISWSNDNILYNKLQSIYNMMQFCSPNISDLEFRNKINDYFKYTDETVILSAIAERPSDYKRWFEILFNNDFSGDISVIGAQKASRNLIVLLRYLESYGNNTGLNYISGMLRLIGDCFKGTEGEWRLADSLKIIKETMDADKIKFIIDKTLLIGQSLNDENKNILSEQLLVYYPEMKMEIYHKLKDYNTLAEIINNRRDYISQILEEYRYGAY